MNKYLMVVECAICHDGKFLLIKRPDGVHAAGLLAFPGGKVDMEDEIMGEDILKNAVKREVFEEVGLILEDEVEYVTSSYFVDNEGTQIIDVIFSCKLEKTIIDVKPSAREVPEYYWLSRQEIMEAANSPEWLKHYLSQIK